MIEHEETTRMGQPAEVASAVQSMATIASAVFSDAMANGRGARSGALFIAAHGVAALTQLVLEVAALRAELRARL